MNVRKRGLALLMCICMIFTLLPFSVFAEDAENGNRGGTEGTAQPSVVYGKYDNGTWTQDANAKDTVTETVDTQGNTITLKKTATPTGNENEYKIDLEVITTETSSTKAGDAATVLVIDVSGSMDKCAECGYTEGYSHNWNYGHNFKSRIAAAQTAAKQFIDAFKSDSAKRYVSVVRFSDNASVACEWKDVSTLAGYKAAIKAIEGLSADGGTNLDAGLQTANTQLSETTVASIKANAKNVIALTDGMPTYYQGASGSVSNHASTGCPITNDRTAASATTLKNSAALYTVCFGASNDKCWSDWEYNKRDDIYEYGSWLGKKYCSDSRHAQDGPTVGDFLKNSIATQATNDKTYAYNAANTNDLLDVFKSITDTITEGISAGTVKDGLPTGVSFVGDAPTAFVENADGTYSWELIPENAKKGTDGEKTTYTYKVSYVVTLDTSDPEFNEDIYHALNTETTFTAGGKVYKFNVPGVKGESPKCTVTYNKGAHGNLAGQDTDGNVVHSSVKLGSATPEAPDVTPDNGYEFTGWDPTVAKTVTEDVTYTAQYKIKDDLSYTVHYYWNGTNDKVAEDKVVESQTFNTIVTEKPAAVTGYTPVSDAAVELTIGTGTNVITFYYYKNVELVANSATHTFDNTAKTVSGYKAYSTEDTAKETELNITFNGVTATRTETQPGTYDVTFTGTTVGAKDTTDKYIVTKATAGELIINPAYQITYQYSNAPENAPTCPVDNAYYADGTTVSPLENPGTLDGYIFSGWKINGEGDAVTGVTFAGANIKLIGEWKPVEGLTCTINYWWMGDAEHPMDTKTVDNLTFGQPYSASPKTFDGYTVENGDEQTITIKTTGNVIDFYYYKNVVLTANSDSATYDGKLHAVNAFKAIVAADDNADIANILKEVLSAYGEGTNAGRYDVLFKLQSEVIPVEALINRPLEDLYYVTDAKSGSLTINPRTVTITSGSASKTYDGTPLTKHESTITGDGFVEGQGVNITYTGSQTEVGSSKNTFEYQFKDNTLEKNYTIETVFGTLTIKERPYIPPVNPPITDKITVEITGNSDSVVYDGTEHSVKDYTVKISDSRYTEKDFTFSGKALASGVNAGAYEMGLKADQFKNTNARFTNVEFIIKADGVLTITQRPLTITAGSAEGIAPVTCDKYTVEGLATGDKVDSVKITGIQSEPGESPNVASDAVIKNAKGEDVTANYKITYVNGVLKAIEVLNKEIHFNYVIGYTDGTIRPNNDISRAEVATIFFRLLTDEAREQYTTTAGNFTDVKAGMWCNRAIATLTNMGIIKGYTDGSFQPNKSITRAELATIIARFAKLDVNTKTFSDINGHWAQKNIELAAGNGWINGYEDGTFRPNNNITRAETFAMINRVLDRQTESVSDLLPTSEMNMWSDNLNENAWYYKDVQEATNYHKCDRVGDSVYEKWTEKVPDIDWASYQI